MGKTKETFMQETEGKLNHLFNHVIRQYYDGTLELETYMDTLKEMDNGEEDHE